MFKSKVIFPDRVRMESPYQLEDCKRRLRDLRRDEVTFTRVDNDRVRFCIRHIKSVAVPFPMAVYEIHGTLRRWAGTGTVIEEYRLQRLTIHVDTWVVAFVVMSLLASILLMLPTLLTGTDNAIWLMMILLFMLGMGLIPLMTWIQHTRTLNIEREIDRAHTAIVSTLGIQGDA